MSFKNNFNVIFVLQNVALHARHKKSPRVEVEDVNIVLKLMDTEPILGPSPPQWVPIGETENLCTTVVSIYFCIVSVVSIAKLRNSDFNKLN